MTEEAATIDQPGAELAPAPVAHIVYHGVREKMVPLEWPVEFDGKTYDAIRVHRVTGKEMRVFMEQLATGQGDVMPPMVDCPIEVWNAMDADDQQTIDLAAMEFTPKRLKAIFDAAVTIDAAGNPAQ